MSASRYVRIGNLSLSIDGIESVRDAMPRRNHITLTMRSGDRIYLGAARAVAFRELWDSLTIDPRYDAKAAEGLPDVLDITLDSELDKRLAGEATS